MIRPSRSTWAIHAARLPLGPGAGLNFSLPRDSSTVAEQGASRTCPPPGRSPAGPRGAGSDSRSGPWRRRPSLWPAGGRWRPGPGERRRSRCARRPAATRPVSLAAFQSVEARGLVVLGYVLGCGGVRQEGETGRRVPQARRARSQHAERATAIVHGTPSTDREPPRWSHISEVCEHQEHFVRWRGERRAGDTRFTRVEDLERIPLEGKQWRPIRRAALGVTGFRDQRLHAADAGDEVIEPHDETSAGAGGHEELYLVVSGAARVRDRRRTGRGPVGTLILIPVAPRVRRRDGAGDDRARDRRRSRLAAGGVAVRVLVTRPRGRTIARRLRGGDQVRVRGARGLSRAPEPPLPLACYNALGGHPDEALEHLRIAEAGNPQVLEWANGDPDLDSIRGRPRYPG